MPTDALLLWRFALWRLAPQFHCLSGRKKVPCDVNGLHVHCQRVLYHLLFLLKMMDLLKIGSFNAPVKKEIKRLYASPFLDRSCDAFEFHFVLFYNPVWFFSPHLEWHLDTLTCGILSSFALPTQQAIRWSGRLHMAAIPSPRRRVTRQPAGLSKAPGRSLLCWEVCHGLQATGKKIWLL